MGVQMSDRCSYTHCTWAAVQFRADGWQWCSRHVKRESWQPNDPADPRGTLSAVVDDLEQLIADSNVTAGAVAAVIADRVNGNQWTKRR